LLVCLSQWPSLNIQNRFSFLLPSNNIGDDIICQNEKKCIDLLLLICITHTMLEILQYIRGLIFIYFHVGLINVGDEVKEINGIKFQGRDPKDMTKVLVRMII
jgi:hypothetical protein